MAKKLVVVDDDHRLAELVGRYLESLGYAVRVTSTGREAVSLVTSWPADLLISDINMPDMDGIEVLIQVRKVSAAPVIAISGGGLFPKELLLGNADKLGAAALLTKPFHLAELASLVESVLGASGTGVEAEG